MNHELDERPDFYKRAFIKATRKPHVCFACGVEIPTGSQAVYTVYKYEGTLTQYYEHRHKDGGWNCIEQ